MQVQCILTESEPWVHCRNSRNITSTEMCQNHLFYFCTNASTDLGNLKNGVVYAIFFNTRRKTITELKVFDKALTKRSFFPLTFFPHVSLTHIYRVKKEGKISRPLDETSRNFTDCIYKRSLSACLQLEREVSR